ncbi:MAG: hypothetical protein AAFO79_01405 [Pseudomonadota bacterium]
MTTTLIIIALLLIAGAVLWFLRGYLTGDAGGQGGLFGAPKERRLQVAETATVDGRRRLVLIQRDGVEHLVMIGGPIDVVIETGIDARRAQAGTTRYNHAMPQDSGRTAPNLAAPSHAAPAQGASGQPQSPPPAGYGQGGQGYAPQRPAPTNSGAGQQPSRGPSLSSSTGQSAPRSTRLEP